MSVEQPDKIDGAGVDKVTGAVVLTISDHLPWDDRHLDILEAKLASYVRYIESGQCAEQFPSTPGQRIDLFLLHRPTDPGHRFLNQAVLALKGRGISFMFGPLPTEGYVDEVP